MQKHERWKRKVSNHSSPHLMGFKTVKVI